MTAVIKVCGIQNTQEALGVIKAGANTIGMLLGVPDYVEDQITPDYGRSIVASLPDNIRTVMVTHLLEVNDIVEIAGYTGVSAVQVHNELSTNEMDQLRRKLLDLELIKAIHVLDDKALKQAEEYEPFSDIILLDTKTKDRIGGTGIIHDWNISKKIVEEICIPVILAGGLNPQNIYEAISKVKPAGIDANSGLENKDGSKDFDKIRLFARAGELLSQ